MERRKFIKSCCIVGAGIPIAGLILSSCESLNYAQTTTKSNTIIVPLSEFYYEVKGQQKKRKFVLVNNDRARFPIWIYDQKLTEEAREKGQSTYVASLLKCTHQGCSLNVGGGVYLPLSRSGVFYQRSST